MRRYLTSLLVTLLVVASAGTAVAATEGHSTPSVQQPDNRIDPGIRPDHTRITDAEFELVNASTDAYAGETGNITLTIEHVGSDTATNARVSLQSGDPALTFGGAATASVFVGDWEPDEVRTVTVSGHFADSAGGRSLPVEATVVFEDDGDRRSSDPLHGGLTPRSGPSRFPVVNASTDVAVGERGPVEITLRNSAKTTAYDTTVTIDSVDPAWTFGGRAVASTFAGDWQPGEVRTIEVTGSLASTADPRPYPLSVTVEYRTSGGETRRAATATTGVVPQRAQSFVLEDLTSTLAVGDQGTLRGAVMNTGETTVRNAVVVFAAENPNVVPVETEYAVGDLAPGETATFTFEADVTDSADAGPRQLSFSVRYRDANDDVRRSDPLDARVDVGPWAARFAVEPVSATFAPGESGVLELRVTNAGDEPVTDVSAKLFADDPLASSDDEAFIDELGPGESTTIRFGLATVGDAIERKVYPVSMDFQYEDADGDTRLSDSYDVPVRVVERQGGGGSNLPVLGGAATALLAVIGGLWYWRRR